MFGRVGDARKAMVSKVWQGVDKVIQKRQNHADDFDELVLLSPKVELPVRPQLTVPAHYGSRRKMAGNCNPWRAQGWTRYEATMGELASSIFN